MSSSMGGSRSAAMDRRAEDGGVARPGGARSSMPWQVISAVLLLVVGGIHLFLVLTGTGGVLGVLFVLNAIGAVVLAVAMILAPRRLLPLASVLSLLFMVGTLLALVIALTVGLFGIREHARRRIGSDHTRRRVHRDHRARTDHRDGVPAAPTLRRCGSRYPLVVGVGRPQPGNRNDLRLHEDRKILPDCRPPAQRT